MMLLDPDDEVLIAEPAYGPLRGAKMFGKLVRVPLKERKGVIDETRWYFDPKELESRITDKSKLFMFANPNNPLGYVYSKDDLNAIARIARQHDLFVFCNECYERQVFSEEFYQTLVFNSLAALPGMMERTFTVERAAHARTVAETKGRRIGRPTAWPADKIDYARLLREQGNSLGEITSKTGIPKTSLHRYLTQATELE